jgi:hypothetical protein
MVRPLVSATTLVALQSIPSLLQKKTGPRDAGGPLKTEAAAQAR